MSEAWYQTVPADEALSQGDLIMKCPLLTWKLVPSATSEDPETAESLRQSVMSFRADVVIMTQVCDLENCKVDNVVLSPHFALDKYKEAWAKDQEARGQGANAKAWARHCDNIHQNAIPNLAFLNEGTAGDDSIGIRVVDFHDVYTAPRSFLEALLRKRGQPRLRLNSSYRNSLSQRFGLYFMRVGLDVQIPKSW